MITQEYVDLKEGLTSHQLEAFNQVIEWAEKVKTSGNLQKKWFVISGYAGTGKSFLTQRLIPAVKEILGNRVGAAAPTHKAVEVLSDFCGRLVSDVSTIHQFLHLKPSDPDHNGKRHLEQISSQHSHYVTYDFMIVDESSMIGKEIVRYIPKKTPTIFLGDIAQLPPVEDNQELSPLLQNPDILLTEVVRYDGEIADYVFKIRNNLTSKSLPRLNTNLNLIKHLDKERWLNLAISEFSKANGPNDIKLLAWTNTEVQNLNKTIRNNIFDESNLLYIEGEQIMAKEPLTVWNRDKKSLNIFLRTCGQGTIKKADLRTAKIGINKDIIVDLWDLEIENSDGLKFNWETIDTKSMEKVNKYLNEFKKEILEMTNKTLRQQRWIKFYNFCERYAIVKKGNNLIHRLQYSYALTIHQSQGSTFQKVFVNGCNVFGCQEIQMRNQMLYTAFTRAKDELHVLMAF